MGSVYKPFLDGERTLERVLEVLEDWIDWHAYRLASMAPGQVDSLYYQDLAQEAGSRSFACWSVNHTSGHPSSYGWPFCPCMRQGGGAARSCKLILIIDCAPMNRCRGRCLRMGRMGWKMMG
jgi:hypothetical protein